MYKNLVGLVAGAVIAIANISAAAAVPSATAMREGGYALAPFSFVKFCIDYPGDCRNSTGPGRVRLSRERMAELSRVNRSVNNTIRPTPDTSAFRYWKLNVSAGDCNSFAVQKRHELIRRGWPSAALALTVAKTPWGEGHLVVTVRTDRGDLVLDNLRPNIVPWQRTGYDWIMRQSERNPQYWVDLDGGQASPVYAAADLDDADVVAQADRVADAPQPSEAKPAFAGRTMRVSAAEVESTRADAPRSPDVASLEGDAARVALEGPRTLALEASIVDLRRWIADNRGAALPAFDTVVAALDRFIETSPVAAATSVREDENEAAASNMIAPTLFGFI